MVTVKKKSYTYRNVPKECLSTFSVLLMYMEPKIIS